MLKTHHRDSDLINIYENSIYSFFDNDLTTALNQAGTTPVLSITGAGFTNNRSGTVTGAQGGALYYSATNLGNAFNITGSVFSFNTANATNGTSALGGAISFNANATLVSGTISNSSFSNNSVLNASQFNRGGAIAKSGAGVLGISGSTFSRNSATQGGAIHNGQGTISVTSSRIQNNTANDTGGAYFTLSGSTDTISGSCIVNNSDTAVIDLETGAQNTTATGNWWGTSWGPQIIAAGGNSAVSIGDSIGGNGTSNINVGLTNANAVPPTGNWLTTAPTVAGSPCANSTPQPFIVTKTADTNDGVCNADCSLREAIRAANASIGDNTITFAPSANGTITLGSALPNISNNGSLTITGNGKTNTVISGNNAVRVMLISSGRITINDLTITRGFSNIGAGISVVQAVSISLNNVAITDNTATSSGGGAYFLSTDQIQVTITNSVFSGNAAVYGGGLYLVGDIRQLIIANSLITNNTAGLEGGGIYHLEGTFTTLGNVTFSGNSAPSGSAFRDATRVTLYNSILVNNSGNDCLVTGFTLNPVYTLVDDGSCGITNGVSGNRTGDPALNPDFTLSSNSIAIDAGYDAFVSSGVTDLALNTRIQGVHVDMGAYESSLTTPPDVTITPSAFNVNEGASANFTITRVAAATANALPITLNITQGAGATTADYTLSGGSISAQSGNGVTVTIPAGSASVNVNLAAATDYVVDANETLTLTLVDGAAYNLGAATSSTATIVNTTVLTTLTVQLTLQGRPAAPNAAYVVSGEVEIRPPNSGTPIIDTTFTADNMGHFTIANVPVGMFDVWVKGNNTLARLHENVVVAVSGGNTLTTTLMLEGDANNDNWISILDFSALSTAFGTQVGGVAYDPLVDFNMDGFVNLIDFSLLASNFAVEGDL